MSGWKGIALKHDDGRTGVIVEDADCGQFRVLTVKVDDGTKPQVQLTLNSWFKDEGESGWQWEFSPQSYPGMWAYLLDIDKEEKESAE